MQTKVHEQENSNFLNKNVFNSCFNSILNYTLFEAVNICFLPV